MGEEVKKEEPKPEEKKEEKAEDKSEQKKEEKEPKPCSPFVLFVDLHCTGCAKKIEKSIMRIRGVEGVVIDMAKNEVTIKGIVEPQAVCSKISKKTKRVAKVLSPLPPAEGEPIPQLVNSQASGITVVELNVNMHCEACAQQLKKKILKMRGVQTAETEHRTGKVVVTGTMDGDKLVDYVYRRTKKQAKIVPQPEPAPETKEENKESEKPAEEEAKADEEKKEETSEGKQPAPEEAEEEAKKEEGEKEKMENKVEEEEESMDKMNTVMEEENIKRMMYHYQYHPLYVIERIPPPQLFSDENPHACCIV